MNIKSNAQNSKSAVITGRCALIYVIGILAFILATASLLFSVKDFIYEYRSSGESIAAIKFTFFAQTGIEIIFSALEIVAGLTLIKQWREGESVEIHKTIAKLIQVIVYEAYTVAIVNEVLAYFTSRSEFKPTLSTVYVVIYIVYYMIMSSMSNYVKRHELMKLYYLMLITSAMAVFFSAGELLTSLSEREGLSLLFNGGNLLLTLLIFLFALSTVIYYTKNPVALRRDVEANEDSDLIKRTDRHEYLRIYSTRASETKINLVINVLYLLAIALGLTATVFFFIEENGKRFFGSTLFEVVDKIITEVTSLNISTIFDLAMLLLVLLIYPLSYFSAAHGIIKRDSRSKILLVTLSTVGSRIMILTNMTVIMSLTFDFVRYRTVDFDRLPIAQWILIALFVAYSLIGKLHKGKTKSLLEDMANGDSYRDHIKEIHRTIIFEGCFSVISLALIFVSLLDGGEVHISYILYIVSTVVIMLATRLELNHPFSEYVKVKRRIIDMPSEEIADGEYEQ